MKRLLLILPLFGLLSVACAESDSEPALEIDPINSAGDKAKGGEDQKGDTAPGPATGGPEAPAEKAPPPATTPAIGPENTCQTALSLGQMDGEPKLGTAKGDTFAAQGHCSKWFKLRVNEGSGGYIGLEVKAKLISPPSAKFDLHAYVNEDKDEIECTTPKVSSATTLSNVDSIDLKWGDSYFSDDSRTVTIEVRAKGSCDATASWSLLVESATMR